MFVGPVGAGYATVCDRAAHEAPYFPGQISKKKNADVPPAARTRAVSKKKELRF